MSEISDLTERIRNGDREALAELLMRYRSRLLRRIRGKITACGSMMDDAEDILLSAARRLDIACMKGRLDDLSEDNLEPYIMTTVLNLAREKIRSERSREQTLKRLLRDLPPSTNESEPAAQDRLVESLLSQLNGWERRMLDLRLRGVPHREIARDMRLTLPAERSRWQRLRQHVKALLTPPTALGIYSAPDAFHKRWQACIGQATDAALA